MDGKFNKSKAQWQEFLFMALFFLVGVVCGLLIVYNVDQRLSADAPFWQRIAAYFGWVLWLCAALYVQVIIHEAGHLVFGLLSGYQFSSFRFLNLIWVKQDGAVKLKRLTIAGTSRQCLMTPPDMADGRFPVILYKIYGVIKKSLIRSV